MSDHRTLWDEILESTHLGENLDSLAGAMGLKTKVDATGVHQLGPDEQLQFGHVLGALVVLAILVGLALASRKRTANTEAAIVPEERLTWSSFVELMVESVYGLMAGVMGRHNAKKFLPLIGTCAFFILFSNVLGLVPGLTPPTNVLRTTLVLSLIIFVATHYYGLRANGMHHVAHLFGPWLGPLGLPLNALMFVIEVVSHCVRPLSLAVRLAGNLTADHAVLSAFLGFGVVSFFVVPLPMYLLGCLVVLVQTAVFCLLSTVYISMSVQEADH